MLAPGAALALAVTLTLTLAACEIEPERTSTERIDEEVARKLATWRKRRAEDCHSSALTRATAIADSLILDYAYAQKMMRPRPSRPVRPDEPTLLRPSDTLVLAPFIRGESRSAVPDGPGDRIEGPESLRRAVAPRDIDPPGDSDGE